jgi:uncharacterized glyoxalase superfamily protein PhnB
MVGVEIDMVVKDSLAALALYERLFDVERVEVTNYDKGLNEAVFNMYGARFHLLDENPKYMLNAPKEGDPKPMWVNVVVPDIAATFENVAQTGCVVIQPITDMADMGVKNAFFADPFGYIWMLHQIMREVSFEERCRLIEQQMNNGK